MKRSSGSATFCRILVWVIAVVGAIGYYSHVFGMEGILANKTAAI